MPKFTSHVFVCCNQRSPGHRRGCCDPEATAKLRERFKTEIQKRNLTPLVRANQAGCLDQCECGPTLVIYPQQIWYGGVTPDDVPRIVEETIMGGRVLDDLLIPAACLNTKGKIAWRRGPAPTEANQPSGLPPDGAPLSHSDEPDS